MLTSQARETQKMQIQTNNKRRARVRTLIQAGALIKLTGLFDLCNIQEGDDLQYDTTSRDKSAVLLGILLDSVHTIPSPPDDRQIEVWQETGIRFLKQQSAQTFYQRRREQ